MVSLSQTIIEISSGRGTIVPMNNIWESEMAELYMFGVIASLIATLVLAIMGLVRLRKKK